jgi:hypothetical protein
MHYVLTEHAKETLQRRSNIQLHWLEQAITAPHQIEKDATDPELTHHLFKIEEFEGRVLRVIVNQTVDPMRIITAFF